MFIELFGERVFDVVLNPCLKNERVRNVLMKELDLHTDKYKMFLEKKVLQVEKQELYKKQKTYFFQNFLY